MKRETCLRKIIVGFILFILAVVLQVAARNYADFANWYTNEVYPIWVNVFARFCSIVPFSVAEAVLYCLLGGMAALTGIGMAHLIRKTKSGSSVLLGGCGNAVLLFGSLFFIYTMMCGINYHSDAFSKRSGIVLKEYTVEELYEYCESVTEEVNAFSKRADRGKLSNADINVMEAVEAMKRAGEEYECLSGYYPRPKGLMVSEILSYQHLTGVYSPFTIEANYNADMTAYNIPFTMCHELSHLRGFMREDEANYIAYLGCMSSKSPEFQYSGALMAWIYSTNLLYDYAPGKYWELHARLSQEVQKDLDENSAFWERYEGRVSEVADKVNDTYLKANKQSDGVKSYDRMVDLLMAEFLS